MAYVNGQENALAGGLRIKKTSTKGDANSSGVVTNYSYENNNQSTATLYSRPRYVQIIRNELVAKYHQWRPISDDNPNPCLLGCVSPDYTNQPYLISPSGIVPMSTTQGYHLGYDQVTVTQSDNGKSEYYYYGAPVNKRYDDVCYRSINFRQCDPTAPFFPAVPVRHDFSRGQLKFERIFSEAGKMLKEIQYTYQYDSSKTVTPALISRYTGGGASNFSNTYIRRSYWKSQMEVTETKFSPDGLSNIRTKKTHKYDSPYHRQLTQLITTNAENNIIEEKSKYVADFRLASVEAIADGTSAYNAACASCDRAYQTSGCNGRLGCLFDAYLNQVVCRADARKAYVAYRRSNFSNRTNAFQTAHNTAKDNADAVLKPILQLQDDYTNPLVETSQWRNGKLLSASYTTFWPGVTQVTNTMYPAKVFSLPLTSPAATFTPAAVNGNSISTDSRYATTPETTLKFDKGNLVEVTTKAEPVTSYMWGYNNTLPIVKATGVDYDALSNAYTIAGGNLTTLRAAPALAKALLTTYAHKPLVGLTSQTDPTGRPTTYEYDALGRLKQVKDEQGRVVQAQDYHYARP
jgi:YD repeat-containing protein